jgi:hypothetical protein
MLSLPLLVDGVHPKIVFEALRHSSLAFTMAGYLRNVTDRDG